MSQKNDGLHAFGSNSADSEPIWMKFGTLSTPSWELALAHFGHDAHCSDSMRGS